MRLVTLLKVLAVTVLLTAAPLFADLVVTGGGAAPGFWNAVVPTQTGNNQPGITNPNWGGSLAYWDHGSFDAAGSASKCNVGWILNGQMSGCTTVDGPAFQSDDPSPNAYWSAGNGNGNYDPSFVLFNNAQADTTELEMRITGYQGSDVFGWYESDQNGFVGALHPLFTGGSSPESFGADITTAYFGFYLTNGSNPTKTFYTGSSNNTADRGIQHFALFRVQPPPTGTNQAQADRFYVSA